jgi:hypothetical protein
MQVNQLIVLPDEGTLNYLRQLFATCPFDLDLDKAYVEVNSSLGEMEPQEHNVYVAEAGSMNVWYDSSTQSTSLLLPLKSKVLTDRCMEIRETAPSLFYGEYYMPFLVIQRGMPAMRRSYRTFINSVSDVLYANRIPLVFGSEFLLPSNFEYVPYTDYYVSQLANHM